MRSQGTWPLAHVRNGWCEGKLMGRVHTAAPRRTFVNHHFLFYAVQVGGVVREMYLS